MPSGIWIRNFHHTTYGTRYPPPRSVGNIPSYPLYALVPASPGPWTPPAWWSVSASSSVSPGTRNRRRWHGGRNPVRSHRAPGYRPSNPVCSTPAACNRGWGTSLCPCPGYYARNRACPIYLPVARLYPRWTWGRSRRWSSSPRRSMRPGGHSMSHCPRTHPGWPLSYYRSWTPGNRS